MHGEERAYRDGPLTLEVNEKTANDSNEFRAAFMRNFEIVLGVSPQPFIKHGDEGDRPPPPTTASPGAVQSFFWLFSHCQHE